MNAPSCPSSLPEPLPTQVLKLAVGGLGEPTAGSYSQCAAKRFSRWNRRSAPVLGSFQLISRLLWALLALQWRTNPWTNRGIRGAGGGALLMSLLNFPPPVMKPE